MAMSWNDFFGEAPSSIIHFRNPHAIAPVIIQMFMIFAAFLILAGLLYVMLLVVAITIHHFIYDREPEKVPDFVKRSIQFSSSEESDEEGKDGLAYNPEEMANLPADTTRSGKSLRRTSRLLAETARKAQNLDRFLYNEERGN